MIRSLSSWPRMWMNGKRVRPLPAAPIGTWAVNRPSAHRLAPLPGVPSASARSASPSLA